MAATQRPTRKEEHTSERVVLGLAALGVGGGLLYAASRRSSSSSSSSGSAQSSSSTSLATLTGLAVAPSSLQGQSGYLLTWDADPGATGYVVISTLVAGPSGGSQQITNAGNNLSFFDDPSLYAPAGTEGVWYTVVPYAGAVPSLADAFASPAASTVTITLSSPSSSSSTLSATYDGYPICSWGCDSAGLVTYVGYTTDGDCANQTQVYLSSPVTPGSLGLPSC